MQSSWGVLVQTREKAEKPDGLEEEEEEELLSGKRGEDRMGD